MPRPARTLLVSSILVCAATLLPAAESDPAIQLTARTVTVSNVTPGADVAIFAVGLDPDGYESAVVRWSAVVTDSGHTGSVTYDAGRDIPRKSVWAAVDLTNGRYATSKKAKPWPAKPFHGAPGGDIDQLRIRAPFVDALYAHPGKGVWTFRAHDGDASDGDGKPDGFTTAAFTAAHSVNGAAGGPHLVPGGVLIVIDLYRLDVTAIRLDAAALQELF